VVIVIGYWLLVSTKETGFLRFLSPLTRLLRKNPVSGNPCVNPIKTNSTAPQREVPSVDKQPWP
jgi:hypothetical protein